MTAQHPNSKLVIRQFTFTGVLAVYHCAIVVFLCGGLTSSPLHAESLAARTGLDDAQRQALPTHFGFSPVEIFKLEHGITQLRTADFNGDGLTDLAVVNNAKSTIEILLQRAEPSESKAESPEVNEILDDWRFEKKRTSITWRINCLQAADVTGDGKADLIFFGEPKELVVLPGKGDGSFDQPITRRVRDGIALPSCVAVGDLNGDGRDDVALLAESDILIYFQREGGGGGLETARRFSHALDDPAGLELADMNGDGLLDLIILTGDEEYPVHLRFQDARGNLGPVRRVKLPALRSGEFAICLDRSASDMIAVERNSGRLKRWSFVQTSASGTDDASVFSYPIPGKSDADRLPIAVGDVDGDGLLDVVTADVDSAELVLFRQAKGTGLLPARTFGGQVKMRDIRRFDADKNGADEVYVLSAEEEFIARSQYQDNRLTFPKAMPTRGKPFALEVGMLSPDNPPMLVYVSRNNSSDYELIIQPLDAKSTDDERIITVALDDLDDPPSGVRLADVNRDGLQDVLIFTPFAALTTVLQSVEGSFALLGEGGSAQKGLVKKASLAGFAFADTDGDGHAEVLLAQGSFVRTLRVNEKGAWEILDQFNAPGADADIKGVAMLPDPGSSRPHLAMYDKRAREVHLFKPIEGGTFALDRSVPVGGLDLKAMLVAPVAGSDQPALVLVDKRRIVLVQPTVGALRAEEKGVYESSIKDARLWQIAVGDLNHDGRTDVVVSELSDHFIEILTFGPDDALVRGTKFRVFAEKHYRQRNQDAEPRWITIADVTGDAHDDLLLIAHDRILLYPSE